ncbi:hypothetical protein BJ742DRAFT_849997 [Cladochytrium replicatum]|nr:hypothetical protein BJ742DRAFT_849997 [Cladochytrium replicatum]
MPSPSSKCQHFYPEVDSSDTNDRTAYTSVDFFNYPIGKMIAPLLALAALPLLAVAQTCDQGVVDGSFCFSDCTKVDGLPFGFYQPIAEPLVTSINLSNFLLEFDSKDPYNPRLTSTNVTADTKVPADLAVIKLSFVNAGTNITVGLPGAAPVARLFTPDESPASGDTDIQKLFLNFDRIPLAALAGAEAGFGELFKTVTLGSGDVPLSFTGYADNKAEAPEFGLTACLYFVPLRVTSTLKGLGGLQDTTITSIPTVVGGSASTGIKLSIPLRINSPSNVVLKTTTDVSFKLTYNNQVVGSVVLPKLSISPGANNLVATGFVFPQGAAATAASRDLLSKFVKGTSSEVTVSGGKSSDLPSLDAAFGAVSIKQTLPAKAQVLILGSKFTFPNLFTLTSKVQITASNPFDAATDITYVKASLVYKDKVIGTLDTDVTGFTIPAKSTAVSPDLKLNLKLNGASILAIFAAIGNSLSASVQSELTISFGGYKSTLDYNQDGVTAKLVLFL